MGSDGENLYARISTGLDGSETVRESEALWALGQDLRALGYGLKIEDGREIELVGDEGVIRLL